MLLRDHPLMQYHGLRSWPPVWTWIDGFENKYPRGEIGILRQVVPSNILPLERCFLYIEHEESQYVGYLLFDDRAFCNQIIKLLQNYCNRPIAEIGSIEVAHTL
jgi:hypothetical protein